MKWHNAGLIAMILAIPSQAQHGSSTVVNPYTSREDAVAGATVFKGRCAGCHGPDGAGTGAGPSLQARAFKHGNTDEALFQTISKGVPGTAMPAFSLGGLQTWQVITHLRTLSVARKTSKLPGNAEAGAKLFRAKCSGCHTVGTEGGLIGPDLTDIGEHRSEAEIREALLRPDASVSNDYWSVKVRTNAGQTLQGTRLNEDTHSVQMRDGKGRLISVLRRDVKEMDVVRKSPMPSFEGKLSTAEMDDLLAFLIQSRGGAR